MNFLSWLARPEFAALAAALLHFLWQGTLIALLLGAVKRLGGIQAAQQRYACSLAALLAMAVCPIITFVVVSSPQFSKHAPMVAEDSVAIGIPADQVLAEEGSQPSSPSIAYLAQPYLLAVWLGGVCLLALRMVGGLVGVWRMGRQRLSLPLALARRVEHLGRTIGIDALPRVFLSRSVGEAVAIGFWRPVVLVPAAWVTEMPLEVLEAVIAHELAHLRRLDLWVNLLQRVVEMLLFYHPAVWWVSRQVRQEREMCCDELAVGATGARLAYVEALELVARGRLAGVRPALAAGIRGDSNMKLLARVRNVLGGTGDASGSLWPAGLLALLLPLAMWAVTFGVLSPTPPAAVAGEDRDDDDDDGEEKKDRKVGEEKRDNRDEGERKKEVGRDGEAPKKGPGDGEAVKKGPRDGEAPRKDGVPRDGEGPKKGPRDGEAIKKGPRDGETPRKEGVPRDGEGPKKGPRDGEAIRKGPRDGEAPKKGPRDGEVVKKVPGDGESPKKGPRDGEVLKDLPKEGADSDRNMARKLEGLVRELRAENARLRAELEKLRGGAAKGEGAVRDELIKRLGEGGEKILDERALIERKRRLAAEQQERTGRDGAKREGERPRDGEGDRAREGDRPREAERREGDRPREGDLLREGDRPREGEPDRK